ncbi:redox-sensitive transcriptional activator SoxR [Salinimonas sp. HHU 13199]|uniref:Redox-sensitive transcriptional activator SoxR n=1 Tax=Salinimonas profundi TaxID=2729140 RepID=A0ABR8LH97_9ALTE|nr:redox-sensitive transcriptional activator SoxR [Salinimonas profundi]MBD3584888.1 redox-sensitive transcriptional activator SoxR [Salinimonas profundi]
MAELSVGQVASRCGVKVSTLHFYETKGLIFSSRNAGNQRRFGRDTMRRVSLIKAAQQLGVSLDEIQHAFASLPSYTAPTQAQWQSMATGWQIRLNERIKRLQALSDSLTGCIGCGCLSMKNCPLYNSQDKLGKVGSGPVLLQRKAGQQ